MKNNLSKNKIILLIAVISILLAVFFFGGEHPGEPIKREQSSAVQQTAEPTAKPKLAPSEDTADAAASPTPTYKPTEKPNSEQQSNAETAVPLKVTVVPKPAQPDKKANAVQDKYQTDPVPTGRPAPAEPQEVVIFEGTEHTCTLSVRCDTILRNMSLLDSDKRELVPSNGVIYQERTVSFNEGESVFDVTLREMKNNKIHFEFTKTPAYNSAYVEGINNIYEFDCGELSGWKYKVNGWFPNYGCSRYTICDGDCIEWLYTCDMGRDIGDENGFNQEAYGYENE